MEKKLVIIPTYNEIENISKITQAVLSLEGDYHILVIDDGSPDGTAGVVKSLMQVYPERLFLLERSGKLGLGTAYVAGFRWALERDYDYIFEMDADFSHNPNDLIRLYNAAVENNADAVVGSRYCNGVNVVNWPMSRILMSYFGSAYVRFILRTPVRDTTAGFICYRRTLLEKLNFERIRHTGYGFQIEMKYIIWKLKFKIMEIPIIFVDRQEGTSKMSSGIFKEAIIGVIRLRFRNIRKYLK